MSKINVVAVSGNIGTPSRTLSLVGEVVRAIEERAAIDLTTIEVGELAADLGVLTNPKSIPPRVAAALSAIASADLLVVGSPVYKGSYTGLFKHLIDFLAPDALIGVPVVLTATGGTDRHALVIEHQLRPLFGFFTAQTVPTGVFALDTDFDNYRLIRPEITVRVKRAAEEAVLLASLGRLNAPAEATA
jgi:FMN reductase